MNRNLNIREQLDLDRRMAINPAVTNGIAVIGILLAVLAGFGYASLWSFSDPGRGPQLRLVPGQPEYVTIIEFIGSLLISGVALYRTRQSARKLNMISLTLSVVGVISGGTVLAVYVITVLWRFLEYAFFNYLI